MKRLLITLFVMLAALSVASVTLAQTPTENACYAGGAWEGKCDWPTDAEDDWAWTCGWYYARLIDGRITSDQYPADCVVVVPVTLTRCLEYNGNYGELYTLCLYSDNTFTYQYDFAFSDDVITHTSFGLINQYPASLEGSDACQSDVAASFGYDNYLDFNQSEAVLVYLGSVQWDTTYDGSLGMSAEDLALTYCVYREAS
jgi:hypothetical protein